MAIISLFSFLQRIPRAPLEPVEKLPTREQTEQDPSLIISAAFLCHPKGSSEGKKTLWIYWPLLWVCLCHVLRQENPLCFQKRGLRGAEVSPGEEGKAGKRNLVNLVPVRLGRCQRRPKCATKRARSQPSPALRRSPDAHSWDSCQGYFWAGFMQVPNRVSVKRKQGERWSFLLNRDVGNMSES